jgi:glycopeptide antibiotics resistance protein
MGKILSRGLLAFYLVILVWLVLFKFSLNISALFDFQHRSLNLIPFAAPSIVNGKINFREMLYNCIVFIPFGLLLNVNFKKVGFLPKLAFSLVFSLSAEIIQYIFAIGATDITDIITNSVGGFLGLKLYSLSSQYIQQEKLDRVIISIGALLLLVFISMVAIRFGRRL